MTMAGVLHNRQHAWAARERAVATQYGDGRNADRGHDVSSLERPEPSGVKLPGAEPRGSRPRHMVRCRPN
jgi:hypothetical protein